ncbi:MULTISPECIES: universal stress protein [Maribacter]|uniref:Universal stress protein n=1 Tax=Maribacter flavus TaxID=1658664 RepID=A0ABU7IG14_9FLAO|nr:MULTISPECIES: universal stress protein [Maribacter]MDC6405299.1 universal stress protein [Maribacter sp. PR66]MEE1971892.1 universal stress protein [Maribacter flavus]
MKHILIPTDFSENSWNALEYAIYFFKNEDCSFYILHVGELSKSEIKNNSFVFPRKTSSPVIRKKLKSLFERIADVSTNDKHHFLALQDYGNFIDIVRKTVETKKIDLIVMGTKGASGIMETIVGSNTGDVITKVLCNVLVIPENASFITPQKIAFPTDYNLYYTYPILKTIAELLRITNANLQVFNVEQFSIPLTDQQEKNKDYLKDYLEETLPKSHSFYSVKSKDVKSSILNFVSDNQINMLTMVAKNLNFLQQILFDTTIEKLSFHTTIPMLVLHE